MSHAENIFSYFVGGLALTSTVVSIILYQRAFLPSARMKLLDELLHETQEIFDKADADGLFPNQPTRKSAQEKLAMFEQVASLVREQTYQATTSLAEYKAYVLGLSKKIDKVSYHVKLLRWFLVSTSEEERQRLRQERCREHLAPVGGAQLSLSGAQDSAPNTRFTAPEFLSSGHDLQELSSSNRPPSTCHLPNSSHGALLPPIRHPSAVTTDLEESYRSAIPGSSSHPFPLSGCSSSNQMLNGEDQWDALCRNQDTSPPIPDLFALVNKPPPFSTLCRGSLWSRSSDQSMRNIPLALQGRIPPNTPSRSSTLVDEARCLPARRPLSFIRQWASGARNEVVNSGDIRVQSYWALLCNWCRRFGPAVGPHPAALPF